MEARIPTNEDERLSELRAYDILDTRAEQSYDDITFLASQICRSPIALMSLVDQDRQWFKSRIGLGLTATPRVDAFCAHAILQPTELLVVSDATQDPRFSDNPLVRSTGIRFYAGAPLVTPTGHALGTLCVMDREPRRLTPDQEQAMRALARQTIAQLELHTTVVDLRRHAEDRIGYQRLLEGYQKRLEAGLATAAEQSRTDPLTELKNRRALLEALESEYQHRGRNGGQMALAILDVDHFKSYNDEFGHPAGDHVLRAAARLLRETARPGDIVARYGGEEFAVLFPQTTENTALVIAERLRRAFTVHDWELRDITVSIGVAGRSPDPEDPEDLISRADQALYRAKQAGRDLVMADGSRPAATGMEPNIELVIDDTDSSHLEASAEADQPGRPSR